jgi:hypothetical protein
VRDYKFAEYFERTVLHKRPYLRKEWCIAVVQRPTQSEPQSDAKEHAVARKRSPLVSQFLENVSCKALQNCQAVIRQFVRRRSGYGWESCEDSWAVAPA